MKKIISVGLGLVIFSTGFAASPSLKGLKFIWPKTNKHNASKLVQDNEDGYTDFTGSWSGECEGSGESIQFVIKNDASHIEIDGTSVALDAITSNGSSGSYENEQYTLHMHWDDEGKSLVGSVMSYYKEGSLSKGNGVTGVAKVEFSLENDTLIQNSKATIFVDGEEVGAVSDKCVLKKQS